MAMVRTFVAVDCSTQLRNACDRTIQRLGDVVDGVRWVQPENLHLTLKFLGDVEDRELHAVCQCVTKVASAHTTFSVQCRSLGAFPNVERPNTIWVGVDDLDGELVNLQSDLESEVAELGFPIERRPFKPHLTLGRTKSRRFQRPEWTSTVDELRDEDFGELSVDELIVYTSELERRGPLHTPLARCSLG